LPAPLGVLGALLQLHHTLSLSSQFAQLGYYRPFDDWKFALFELFKFVAEFLYFGVYLHRLQE
jgi:hypothetical protein